MQVGLMFRRCIAVGTVLYYLMFTFQLWALYIATFLTHFSHSFKICIDIQVNQIFVMHIHFQRIGKEFL